MSFPVSVVSGKDVYSSGAQARLSQEFVLNDLTVVGSLAGGGDLGDVDLMYVSTVEGDGYVARCVPRLRVGLGVSRRCCWLSHENGEILSGKENGMKSNPTRAGPSSFGNLHSNLERGYAASVGR